MYNIFQRSGNNISLLIAGVTENLIIKIALLLTKQACVTYLFCKYETVDRPVLIFLDQARYKFQLDVTRQFCDIINNSHGGA